MFIQKKRKKKEKKKRDNEKKDNEEKKNTKKTKKKKKTYKKAKKQKIYTVYTTSTIAQVFIDVLCTAAPKRRLPKINQKMLQKDAQQPFLPWSPFCSHNNSNSTVNTTTIYQ